MLPFNPWTSICTNVSVNCTKNLCLSLMKRSMCNLSFHPKSCLIIPPYKDYLSFPFYTRIFGTSGPTSLWCLPTPQLFIPCLFVPICLHHYRASQHHQHLFLEYKNRPSSSNNTSNCESLASINLNPSNSTESINRSQPSDINRPI